jgi:chorismate mutase
MIDEVIRGWRKLHNKELHNMYSSLSTITMMKSGRMKLARHVARIKAERNKGYWP